MYPRFHGLVLPCLFLSSLTLAACDEGGESDGADSGPGERLTEPLPDGDPIEAPDDEWTWVDFPDTRCMDDSPTGLGVQMKPDSNKVLIVIQGGGACFNTTTCLAVANPNGFDADALAPQTELGLLNSDDETNPFRDWNKVFIPYCSGDIFSGAALDGTGYNGRTQAGYLNFRHYLTRLVPTFAGVEHVVLSGYSAGGFAASINWVQAIEGWGDDVRVDVLNDSGPPLAEKYLTPCLQKRLAETWNWAENIPPTCDDCDLETGHVTEPVMRWSIQSTREFRHGLISSSEDSIIKLFYGFGQNECEDIDALTGSFEEGLYFEGLKDLQENVFADHPGARSFIVESTNHVWSVRSPGDVVSEGVTLSEWIEDFLDPEADWQSVIPDE